MKKATTQQASFTFILICCLFLTASTKPDKLQGEIDRSDGTDNDAKMSGEGNGQAEQKHYLKGLVNEEGTTTPFAEESATNSGADPDAQDKELMVEWDQWRNRFLQAVLSGTGDILNSDQAQHFQFNPQTNTIESKYPFGTVAWFSCRISKAKQITDIRIEHSSGFANYDQCVIEALKSMNGSSILQFPSRSRRVSVLQAGGVQRATQPSRQYFRFGDVEHYRVPAN